MAREFVALGLACMLSPVVATAIGALAFFGELGPAPYLRFGFFGAAFIGASLGVVIGIPTMLLVGLPLHTYFQRRGLTGLKPYSLGGACAGALGSLVLIFWPPAGGDWRSWFMTRWTGFISSWESSVKLLFFGALTGAPAASLFSILSRAHRFAPNPPTSAP